ncbi:uncharacterized protein LOC120329956 [Styela clava]
MEGHNSQIILSRTLEFCNHNIINGPKRFKLSYIILIYSILIFIICGYGEANQQKRYINPRNTIIGEHLLKRLSKQKFGERFRRGTYGPCRWIQHEQKLDCKLKNIRSLGGLKKISKKSARILDLRHCKISNAEELIAGFKAMPYLNQILLDFNIIDKVPETMFSYNRKLRIISLHGNRIKAIPEKLFYRNVNLEMLRLSRNQLTTLPPKFLFRNRKLTTIELWENDIKTIPPRLFWNNRLLQYVSFSWNKIRNLPPTLFQRNTRLHTVKLYNNQLRCISSRQFEKNYSLKKVNLGVNQLVSLPTQVFWHNPKLEDVRIWSNKMNCLPTGVFDFNRGLSYVNLLGQSERKGQLKYLQRVFRSEQEVIKLKKSLDRSNTEWCEDKRPYGQCFWDQDKKIFNCESALLTSLDTLPLPCDVAHLNLANNRLENMKKLESVFQTMPDLITITLSENKLNTTSGELFHDLRRLESVDLSRNDLKTIPWNLFQRSYRLREVDLSQNSISEIHHTALRSSRGLRKVNLGHNLCEDVPRDFFVNNPHLKEVYINDNKIPGLPDDLFKANNKIEKLDLSSNNLEYISALVLKSTLQLREINLKENRLIELEEDLFRNLLYLQTVDLSNNYIEFLPEDIFKENENLRRVYLNGNQLYKVNQHLFDNNPFLNFVSLDANFLADVPENMFSENKQLEALGLQHNCISTLPENLLQNTPRLREISLRGNPTLPWDIRRVFEGKEEISDLRKKLKHLGEEPEESSWPTEESEERPTASFVERETENVRGGRKTGNRNPKQTIEGKYIGHIPVEKLRDAPKPTKVSDNPQETTNSIGAEEVDFVRPEYRRDGPDNSEGNSRKRRSLYHPKHDRRKREIEVPRDFEGMVMNVDEESLEAVCMRVWKKNGLI